MNALLEIAGRESLAQIIENVKGIFSDFQWTDAIDIILLAVLFYFVFSFFKSRKAGTLLIGIFLCLLLYTIAVLLNLSGIEYILSGVFKIGALAIIIIFQPEIRDLLDTIGSGSIKGIRTIGDQNKKKQAKYKAIDNICKAVHVMSKDKTGALIVIGRTTQLDDIAHSGIEINADVSDYLLRNIFFNKAPLHDGAVVIEGNRIKSAACILPLPRHTYVHTDLGTRHRAAIGLSEISDAIIIIVSEETGIISVAKESELKRDFTEDSLRKLLVKELVADKHNQDSN